MTGKKLRDTDKSEILTLYRHTGETTSTLAERYGVSNSTISRLLKATLPEQEYEVLIASKRAARTSVGEVTPPASSESVPDVVVAEPVVEVQPNPETTNSTSTPAANRRRATPAANRRRATPAANRRRATPAANRQIETLAKAEVQLELLDTPTSSVAHSQPEPIDTPTAVLDNSPIRLDEDADTEASKIAEMLGEELLDESEDITDLDEDEDLDDLDEDEDELDEDTDADLPLVVKRRLPVETLVQVLPLSEANLPKTCYLVIDRAAELITRPLRDFGDLGQIPSQEVQQKTLPVFDNHRVARRFSTKRDRVIKVPDSRMLQKASSQLQAKGITRLLVDGQVYSLSR
ncbi:transposase [Chroococcidiopsis sp. CCMEE 29]|uniref:transposase n=1 Tax=Chroococcidiopsis sp. CCMEE 29 TaxID=155894 RepID=UPI00201FE7A9|nr:transposase [Chroococcidiopsis sp. CCMEE 29]